MRLRHTRVEPGRCPRRRTARTALLLGALLALASGCAGGTGGGSGDPQRLSQVDAPGRPLRLCVSGLDADADGRHAAALGQYERAIQIDPTNPYAYLALARHQVESDEPERALQTLDEAQMRLSSEGALSPGAEANLAGLRGSALLALGRDGSADLRKAQRLAPSVWADGRLDADELR